jgi:phosphoesterase RecJ-like protein
MDEIEDEKFNGALVIIVDVAVSYLVSDTRYTNASKVWVIDHHKNECDITDYKLVDTTRSAAAEYIAYLVMMEGIEIPKEAATALYGGIITDSGRFMYGANLSETLRVSASLIDFGADAKYIYDNIYIETLQEREMKNYFQERIKFKDGVAWLENGQEVFDKFKCEFNDISRGMLSLMAGIEEIKIWCNFTYDIESNTVKCEFRSRGVEIVDVAKSALDKVKKFFDKLNPFKSTETYDKAAARTATGLGVGAGAASAYAKVVENAEQGGEE